MLLRISEKFGRHYRLKSLEREEPPRPFPLTWNVDLRAWGKQLLVLATEEYTLFSVLLAMNRARSVEAFQEAFRGRLKQLLENIGWWQLPHLPMITFAKRQNRSIIGSQNDLWHLTGAYLQDMPVPVSEGALQQVEMKINQAPMSYLGMESPDGALLNASRKPLFNNGRGPFKL